MQQHYFLFYSAAQHINHLLIIKCALILGKPLGMLSVIYAPQPLTFTATKSICVNAVNKTSQCQAALIMYIATDR